MFSIFRSDPTKKLRKTYDVKLEQAMQAQRNGNMKSYAMITADAEEIYKQIQNIENIQK